jgi:autotransporter-associated beta strand protein
LILADNFLSGNRRKKRGKGEAAIFRTPRNPNPTTDYPVRFLKTQVIMKKSHRRAFVPSTHLLSQPAPRDRRLLCLGLAGSAVCFASPVTAADVSMNTNDALGTSSFNNAGHWDDLAAPAPANEYFTGPFTVRTPADTGTTYVFGGNSLTLNLSGRLLGKTTGTQTLDFPNGGGLILDGGTLLMANATTGTASLKITGKVTVYADSWLGALGAVGNGSASFETLEIAAPITGSGWLTVGGTANGGANTGVVKLSAANPFTGTFDVRQPGSGYIASLTNRLLQLNHREAVAFGKLSLNTTAANGVSFAAAANTGEFKIGALEGSANQVLNDTAGNPVVINIGGNNEDNSYSGLFTGTGSLIKSGTGGFYTDKYHTYTGNTTVLGGSLNLSAPCLHNSSTVTIANGAAIDLSYSGTDQVQALILGGVAKAPGIYNSSTPGGYITGEGSIEVYNGPPLPETVTMTGKDVGNAMITSFNGDVGHWSVPGAPIPANRYVTGANDIRTPALTASGDAGTFAGKSLSIDAGGVFLGKAGASTVGSTVVETITINDFILNGGTVFQAGVFGSSATLVIGGNITVAADSVLGALGSPSNGQGGFETLEITAAIGGSAGLRIGNAFNNGNNTGVVKLSAANTYTGTLTVARPGSGFITSATNRLLQLNHPNALQSATLALTTTVADGMSFSAAANTGVFKVGALTGTASQILADTTGAGVILNLGGTNADSSFGGILTGPGQLQKSGTGKIVFSEISTYTGNTTVSGGILELAQPFLNDTSTVSVAGGAVLNLPHGTTDVVGGLVLNGVPQAVGTYDSTNSGGRITGSGKIQVVIPAGFASFMDGYAGLTPAQKTADADPDGDGISNLLEYALNGSDPTVPNRLPSLENGTITFAKRAVAVSGGDISYVIETSPTLGAAPTPWTTVSATDTAASISYSLPAGQPKVFIRLRVSN